MTAIKTHRTEITSDPRVPLVRITRAFDAPPTRVSRVEVRPSELPAS